MKFGKTIKIFLIDGDPNGRMTCELSNWTGKAYKIPRTKVQQCSDRTDMSNTGIYLLFGKDENDDNQIYIGEAENSLKRLTEHLTQKDFWNEAIVFISKDENLNKAHVKYLENRLHQIASNTKQYKIENKNIPTQSSISEADRAEMEEFLENIRLLVNTLGHKPFEDKRERESNISIGKEDSVFVLTNPREGASAQGCPTSDGFVVFKGSKIAKTETQKIPQGLTNLRKKIVEKSIIDENLEFTDDYIFTSPSAAAGVVLGRSANGLTEWRSLDNPLTLKGYYEKIQQGN